MKPFERKDRDESLKRFYDLLAKRQSDRKTAGNSNDRKLNPLICVYAAPGAGKSFFLDEVAKLSIEDLDKLCPDPIRPSLKNAFPICITFTNGLRN